jgi:hypothetical protein
LKDFLSEISVLLIPIVQLVREISRTLQNDRAVVVTAGAVIFALIIDMELSNVADILHGSISSNVGVTVFIIISVIYLIGQYVLLRFSKFVTSDLRTRRKDVHFIDSIVSVVQIVIIIVFLLIITEIILGSSYDLVILIIVVTASNGLTAVVMMFLFSSKNMTAHQKSFLVYVVYIPMNQFY